MLFNVFKKIFRSDDPTVRNSDGGFDSINMRDFEIFVSKNSNLLENLKLLEKAVYNTFSSREDAFKFVCYELDAASYGNETAINFVKNSGVTYTDYNGAMNSCDQKGSDILLELSPKIAPVMSMMANVRIYVVDKIMQKYEIGKYSNHKNQNIEKDEIKEIVLELRKFLTDERFMSNLVYAQTMGLMNAGDANDFERFNNLLYKLSKLTGIEVEDLDIEDILVDPIVFKENKLDEEEEYSFDYKADYEASREADWRHCCEHMERENTALDNIVNWAKEKNINAIPLGAYQLRRLKILNLSALNLTELPKGISYMDNLETLILDDNNLEYIPDEICKLKRLKILSCKKNNIKKLPENIGNLSELTELDMSYNELNKYNMPISMIKLKNIQKLDFRMQKFGNKLTIAECENYRKKFDNGDESTLAFAYWAKKDNPDKNIFFFDFMLEGAFEHQSFIGGVSYWSLDHSWLNDGFVKE